MANKYSDVGGSKPLTEEAALALDTDMLRFLAKEIADEAHLQRILGDVADAAVRLEVERLLRPMLTFKVEPASEPIIMCGCEDWDTCSHPWPAIFRVHPPGSIGG